MATTYAVIYTYTGDTALREATRPAHREYLAEFVDSGSLLVAGAFAPTEEPGGLLIFRVADKAAVRAILDKDPYGTAGVVQHADIREWAPPLGPLAGAFTGA